MIHTYLYSLLSFSPHPIYFKNPTKPSHYLFGVSVFFRLSLKNPLPEQSNASITYLIIFRAPRWTARFMLRALNFVDVLYISMGS